MSKLMYEVILIGDTGAPLITRPDPVLSLLRAHLPASGQGCVVFLGDNVYPIGLPPEDHRLRTISEARLLVQLDVVKDFPGKLIFISGNHDWKKGRRKGYEYVLRQEKFIGDYLLRQGVFLPAGGCPGPEEIVINKDLVIIVINTQWWVQKWDRPTQGCHINTEEDFFEALRQSLARHHHKHILVVGHLPVYSDSVHGGKFKWKHHLFPLTLYYKSRRAYFPMPLLGSMFTLYRKYIGAEEDYSHPRYRRLRKRLIEIFKQHPNLMYASGHDHNLQHIIRNHNHFIVSGAGSKVSYVKPGRFSHFARAHQGFFKVKVFEDLSMTLEAWEPRPKRPEGKMVYHNRLT